MNKLPIALLSGAALVLTSCYVPYGTYGSYNTGVAAPVAYDTSAAWSAATYDASGYPIYGYSYGQPVYGYTDAGVAITTIAALTALCCIPNWGPADWYRGPAYHPRGRRYSSPPRHPNNHKPNVRPSHNNHSSHNSHNNHSVNRNHNTNVNKNVNINVNKGNNRSNVRPSAKPNTKTNVRNNTKTNVRTNNKGTDRHTKIEEIKKSH